MNKNRALYLLFKPEIISLLTEGYVLIHKHTYPNDEPPYISVSFWGTGFGPQIYEDDGESISHYQIRTSDAAEFIAYMNEDQRDYLDYYIEGILTRNAGEHNMSPRQYAEGRKRSIRHPRIKFIYNTPNTIMKLSSQASKAIAN